MGPSFGFAAPGRAAGKDNLGRGGLLSGGPVLESAGGSICGNGREFDSMNGLDPPTLGIREELLPGIMIVAGGLVPGWITETPGDTPGKPMPDGGSIPAPSGTTCRSHVAGGLILISRSASNWRPSSIVKLATTRILSWRGGACQGRVNTYPDVRIPCFHRGRISSLENW